MSTPEEHTLNPSDARRKLNQSQRSKRQTDDVIEKAAVVFDRSRFLGESNGFVETVRGLIRGAA